MLEFRTLTQRFGALYALVLFILIAVSVVVTTHLTTISVDSERLVEEAREQEDTARLISEINALSAALGQPRELGASNVEDALDRLRDARARLANLEGASDDPSSLEHQEDEERIAVELSAGLAEVDKHLRNQDPQVDLTSILALLSDSEHFAQVLLAEARSEALEADQDLRARARMTRTTLLVTWLVAILLLGIALVQIQRSVVRPLQLLRDGTVRFGSGQRNHRIPVSSRDEIGVLATSFNTMADKLAQAQTDLEARVRQRTQQFIRAARLADLGVLASGIAHELNTPLASISSSSEGLARRANDTQGSPALVKQYCDTISREAFRASEITTRMLGLVRQEPSDISQVALSLVVEQAASALAHRAAKRSVTLSCESTPDEATVSVNPGELVQILVNLLANAIDASANGGSVSMHASASSGRLKILVRDQGSGIPEESLERIWDPFFTTKPPGEGTGLGLALVSTMIEFRSGTISVQSEANIGTTFELDLPADWKEQR